MKTLTLTLLLATLIMSGCDQLEQIVPGKEEDQATVEYVIPAGEHYSTQSALEPLKTTSIKFKAMFDSSAIYKTQIENNQGDINKLYGMSDCTSAHHDNSARFGWVWNNNRLEIWAYSYANSQRNFTFIDAVSLDAFNTYEIAFSDSTYDFKLNNAAVVRLPRACNSEANGYKLYPYFGGDEPAPHEIRITIEDLE